MSSFGSERTLSKLRTSMVERVAAVEAAKTTYHLQPFEWGRYDCARLFAAVARRMGHPASMSIFGHYSSLLSARKALRRNGFETVIDWVDSMPTLERTAFANCIVGDFVALPGADLEGGEARSIDFPALTVCAGNGRLWGYHEGVEAQRCVFFAPTFVPLICWRPRCPS